MNKCPYCDYVTPTSEPGTTRAWQEIAHMQLDHPEVIAERLRQLGPLAASSRFEDQLADE